MIPEFWCQKGKIMAKILSIQGIPDEMQERMAYIAQLHKISIDELVLIACSDWMSRQFQEAWHKGQKNITLQPTPSIATQPYYDVVLDHTQNTPSDKIIELIDLLRIEHGIIKESLNDIHKTGIKTHTGQKIFSALFDLLKTHLKKEEKFIYPAFKHIATHDNSINDLLLSAYAQEYLMTATIIQFFESMNKKNNHELQEEFISIKHMLITRIKYEEDTIFKIYLDAGGRPPTTHDQNIHE